MLLLAIDVLLLTTCLLMSTINRYYIQKALCPPPKMAKILPEGRKTARRVAERPPTGKPKLSRVTSGCGEDIIPLSRVRETPKNGGYMGVA